MEKKLDIIIPAYHAQDTIGMTLSSIACQSIRHQVKVTICNDEGRDHYQDFVQMFSPMIDVEEIYVPKNGGCGVARQYGIDNTNAPFLMCMDADDTLATPFSLEIILKTIEKDEKHVMVSGSFSEQLSSGLDFKLHRDDMIWMHGKMYRRTFLDKYGIRFNLTRSNEDNGFNTKIRLLAEKDEKIVFLPDVVYIWHYKADSITRINNHEYTYNQSFQGYVDNMIDAIQYARAKKPHDTKEADGWGVQMLAELYVYLEQCAARDPRFVTQNFHHCVRFYKEIFLPMEERIDRPSAKKLFAQVVARHAAENADFLYSATFAQYYEQLKGAVQDHEKQNEVSVEA